MQNQESFRGWISEEQLYYEGHVKVNTKIPHGEGLMIYRNGSQFEGNWNNGKKDGDFTISDMRDNTNYFGHFENDKTDTYFAKIGRERIEYAIYDTKTNSIKVDTNKTPQVIHESRGEQIKSIKNTKISRSHVERLNENRNAHCQCIMF